MKQRHTVLVVDDESDVVASVKDLLRLDYKVLGATRAAEGLAMLDREPVHVVMTDQRMPDITGVELLQQVREKHPDAMRLLFTGYADIRAVVDAINRGSVYRYITKPWDPDELMAIIREASHELRTPLTILMGMSDLASRQGGAVEPLAGWIKRIHAAGLRLKY